MGQLLVNRGNSHSNYSYLHDVAGTRRSGTACVFDPVVDRISCDFGARHGDAIGNGGVDNPVSEFLTLLRLA